MDRNALLRFWDHAALFLKSGCEFREPKDPDPTHAPAPDGIGSGDAAARKHKEITPRDGKKLRRCIGRYKGFRSHTHYQESIPVWRKVRHAPLSDVREQHVTSATESVFPLSRDLLKAERC